MTYKSLSILGREAHFVARFGFIKEVSASLEEAKDRVKQAIDAIASLLSDAHQHFVESRQKRGVDLSHFD
jgi:hypothetical protein